MNKKLIFRKIKKMKSKKFSRKSRLNPISERREGASATRIASNKREQNTNDEANTLAKQGLLY